MKSFHAQVLGGLFCFAVGGVSALAPGYARAEAHAVMDLAVHANNDFGTRLFDRVLNTSKGQNTLVSPVSAFVALSMLYNGASGQTQNEMARALEVQGLSLESLNGSNAALVQSLSSNSDSLKVSVVNSMWMRQGFQANADYLSRVSDAYDAKVSNLDFNSPTAPTQINDWVAQATNNRIESIVGPTISLDTVMYLINASYFKGDWTHPFKAENTVDGNFTSSAGQAVTTKMMRQTNRFHHLKNDSYEAISLEYGANAGAEFLVLLPSENTTLSSVAASMKSQSDWDSIAEALDKTQLEEGSLEMPKFSFDNAASLKKSLGALGMESAFTAQADFRALSSSSQLFVSDIFQKSFVAVDEKGTEAAAATSVVIGVTSVGPAPAFKMIVNRPFLFAIRDRSSGALLFIGALQTL